MQLPSNHSRFILGLRIDCTSYHAAVEKIILGAVDGIGGYVCVCNVHMVMEAYDDSSLKRIVDDALLVTPDGMPLVWGLKLLGLREAERVYGPTLTFRICERAAKESIALGFYGSTPETLTLLRERLQRMFPSLSIVYSYAPPFAELTEVEDEQIVRDIRQSGARILFVGLGCPKQERWMAEHTAKLQIVTLGVGAAFDFISGIKPQAPLWVQNVGLEWLFRLLTEPRRLWKRYLYQNPRFLYYFTLQLLRSKEHR